MKTPTEAKLLCMHLFKEIEVNEWRITKVPNGWLFERYVKTTFDDDVHVNIYTNPVFIPEDE